MPHNYVIGDIHGCIRTLEKMLFEFLKIQKDDNVYFLGDYVDRGPDSKAVLDLIMSLADDGYNIFPLMGNHEFMMLMAYHEFIEFERWEKNGAKIALKSFGIKKPNKIPIKYIEFISKLKYFMELENFFIVHAGFEFDKPNPYSDVESMLWTRENYVDLEQTKGKRVISGHTPHTIEAIKNSLNTNRIFLDAGCVYLGRHEGMGNLAALDIDEMKLYFVEKVDFSV